MQNEDEDKDVEKKDVSTEEVQEETPQKTEITNIGQAIGVLLQGVEVGRERGIYSWDNLEVISKAIKFINTKVPKPVTPETKK